MEDVNSPSQSTDVEQPHHPVNHSRPFFYVQPPTQPYFMYQWPMDPFGQYGFPGPALPFGRPYMAPYQYMQYPGYVVPHAPMQPNDYRRMTPLFPSVASYDLRFRQHVQQMSMHRETTSSEAQTEPGDSVNKLVNSLDGLQTREKSGADRDSKFLRSSNPAVTSFCHEVEKMNLEDESDSGFAKKTVEDDGVKPGMLSDSAVFDTESSQGRLEECVLLGVLPIDSSSVHEERQNLRRNDRRDIERFQKERSDPKDASNVLSNRSVLIPDEVQDSGACVSEMSEKSEPCEGKTENQDELPPDSAEVFEPLLQGIECNNQISYQILRLPCNKTTTESCLVLQKDVDPLLYLENSSSLLPGKRYSFGSICPYSYYPQVTQERQSVLSPSLDELSSREDMFSTDVEDELMAGQVYVGGDKPKETGTVPTQSNQEPRDDESCSVCICCGASLPDEEEMIPAEHYGYLEKDLAHMSDPGCDFELEGGEESTTYQPQKSTRQHASRHPMPSCGRQTSKHKARKVQEGVEVSEQDQGHPRGDCGEQLHASAKMDRSKGKGQKGGQARSYSEHQWREGRQGELVTQESWNSCNSKPRSRPCRPGNELQEKGRPGRRRPSCKMFTQQRPRRNEYDDQDDAEFSHCQRGRGSMKRRGTRY